MSQYIFIEKLLQLIVNGCQVVPYVACVIKLKACMSVVDSLTVHDRFYCQLLKFFQLVVFPAQAVTCLWDSTENFAWILGDQCISESLLVANLVQC